MPGEDQYVSLPDGSYVHVPGNATPDQLTQFRSKLSSQFADPLKTGAGMEAAAHEQARETPATAAKKMQPNYTALAVEHTPSGADPHNAANPNLNAIPESERENVNRRLATTASFATPGTELAGELAEAGSLRPLIPFARSAVGGYYGHKYGEPIGRAAGSVVGLPEVGATVGGAAGALAGGYAGYKGLKLPTVREGLRTVLGEAGTMQVPERFPAPPMEPPPPLEETAAVPGETAAERLRAHRGDVRTPVPAIPTIRRGPGEILPEAVSSGPEARVGAPPRSGNTVLPGGAVIQRPPAGLLPEYTPSAPLPARPIPPELPHVSSMDRLQSLIQTEGAGTPPLKKDVPLGEQLFTPRKPVTEMPSVGQKVSDVINQNTETEAVRPLASGPQKSTKLRDITEPPAEPVTHRATVTHEGKTFGMEAANGKAAYEATKDNPALAKSLHDLRNNDVRQAFLNAGGDVNTVGMEGQRFKVGNTTSNERSQMFDYMLKKGLKPEEIIKLARQKIQ